MEWLNFRHLYSFWMVYKKGGFQKAAEYMHVSQSTVSEQVKLLEDYFQEDLFERIPRHLKLTDSGKELVTYANDIFAKSREINQFLKDGVFGSHKITLNIGITGSISRNLLYRFFGSALENENVAGLSITGGRYQDLVRACNNYELDFFISDGPPNDKEMVNLHTKVLFKSPVILAGKKRLINKIKSGKGGKVDLYHFKHSFIEEDSFRLLEEKYKITLVKKLFTDDVSLLRFFANSGDGVSIIPEIGVYEDLLKNQVDKVNLLEFKWIDFFVNYTKESFRKDIVKEILSDDKIHAISKSVLGV